MGATPSTRDELARYLDGAAALGGVVSAAEAIVATPGEILFRHAAGFRVGGERLLAAAGARFDAASLTKLWAATLAVVLDSAAESDAGRDGSSEEKRQQNDRERSPGLGHGQGQWPSQGQSQSQSQSQSQKQRQRLPLGERLDGGDARELADVGVGPAGAAGGAQGEGPTLEDLLRHRAGLPAWTFLPLRLGRRLGDRGELVRFLLDLRREGSRSSTPLGSVVYSDLDYLLWGLIAEERAGCAWRQLLDERVCAPLGIEPVGAATRANAPATAVECRLDNGREVELAQAQGLPLSLSRSFLLGVPQDGNARALLGAGDGIEAAHAGLFVTADQMLAVAREWLRPGALLTRDQVGAALAGGDEYALGWQRWSEGGSASELPRSSFGHTGFTGGSVWIDPDAGRIYLLLAHRLASSIDFAPFRREFHRLAAAIEIRGRETK